MSLYNQGSTSMNNPSHEDAHAFDYRPSEEAHVSSNNGHERNYTTTTQQTLTKEMEMTQQSSNAIHGNSSEYVEYGHTFPENEQANTKTTKKQWISSSTRDKIVQGFYIGILAILGAFLRIITAQLFGEECNNPGTVGWLASGSPLCVTGSRQASEEGGIIFADLPANMLGSFIMGLFASCATLRLAVSSMKIAWLRPNHPFQNMTILHKAITTGMCGSLTTFSGWNSSMVILLFGTGFNRSTHVFNALFGYIIGMEVSLGCYVAGKSLARRLYRWVNPTLARETDAMWSRQEEGIYLNPDLPDFERRYLPNLEMGKTRGEKDYGETVDSRSLEYLTQWRTSTEPVRRVHHPLLSTLNTIEKAVLVDPLGTVVPLEAESIAHTHGWNVAALREWARAREQDPDRLPSISSHNTVAGATNISDAQSMLKSNALFTIPFAGFIFVLIMATLLGALLWIQSESTYAITDRTMAYAVMWAPLGAWLRWELSSLNGSLSWEDWKWFPLGTFTANVLGSILSIIAIAMEYMMQPAHNNFWAMGTIRAIKVGFVGALTTVSTFVAEVDGYIINHTDHAYPYMLTTLGCCCAISSLVYAMMVYYPTSSS